MEKDYSCEVLAREGESCVVQSEEDEVAGWVVFSPLVSCFEQTSEELAQVSKKLNFKGNLMFKREQDIPSTP